MVNIIFHVPVFPQENGVPVTFKSCLLTMSPMFFWKKSVVCGTIYSHIAGYFSKNLFISKNVALSQKRFDHCWEKLMNENFFSIDECGKCIKRFIK